MPRGDLISLTVAPSPVVHSPAPSRPVQAPNTNVIHIVGDVVSGVWSGVTSSAWAMLGATLFVLLVCVQGIHALVYPRGRRDPVRRFPRQDKIEIMRRAGSRCEHHGWITGRCRRTENLEADHVIPWSRSGPTIVGNGQALCRGHNRQKLAAIPYKWQLNALAKRRAAYFPPGVSCAVVRRASSARASGPRRRTPGRR
jgi:hypothetical protein